MTRRRVVNITCLMLHGGNRDLYHDCGRRERCPRAGAAKADDRKRELRPRDRIERRGHFIIRSAGGRRSRAVRIGSSAGTVLDGSGSCARRRPRIGSSRCGLGLPITLEVDDSRWKIAVRFDLGRHAISAVLDRSALLTRCRCNDRPRPYCCTPVVHARRRSWPHCAEE
jgi:hypothetical protein